MKITSSADVGKYPQEERIYTIELEKCRCIDVKLISRSGLIYIMQNEDGSEVYDPENWGVTYPKHSFDKDKVLEAVRESYLR